MARRNPRPVSQADLSLPPRGVLLVDPDDELRVLCHVCGDSYVQLGTHVRSHDLTADEYRERYELNRTARLVSPAQAALLAEQHREHLARIRPAESPLARLTSAEISAVTSQPRRRQMRIKRAADASAQAARRPRRPKPPAPPKVDGRTTEERRVALRAQWADPAWRAARVARVRASRRTLTEEQVREIAALRGQATYAEVQERYRVSTSTITRIWRGERTS